MGALALQALAAANALPRWAKVAIGGTVLILAVLFGVERFGEHREAAAVQLASRKDSLVSVKRELAPIAKADTQATAARAIARVVVAKADSVRRTPSHHVAIVSDSQVTVTVASGADSTVTTSPQLVTALVDARTQIRADSILQRADSVKIATLEQRQPLDSAAAVLETRIADAPGSSIDASPSHTKLVVAVTAIGAFVVYHFLHH